MSMTSSNTRLRCANPCVLLSAIGTVCPKRYRSLSLFEETLKGVCVLYTQGRPMKLDHPFVSHPAQLAGQGWTADIKKVGELVPVERHHKG